MIAFTTKIVLQKNITLTLFSCEDWSCGVVLTTNWLTADCSTGILEVNEVNIPTNGLPRGSVASNAISSMPRRPEPRSTSLI